MGGIDYDPALKDEAGRMYKTHSRIEWGDQYEVRRFLTVNGAWEIDKTFDGSGIYDDYASALGAAKKFAQA